MNKELQNLIKRFRKDNHLIIKDGYLARQLVKKPEIKTMRKNGDLFIGHDRAKQVTVFLKKPKL